MHQITGVEISVVIPVYNREHLVARAIQSVLKQTHENFEVLVIDDASTDRTGNVVRSFADSRIRYIRRELNGGNAAARNTGIQQACGRLITFLDSDDEYAADFLSEVCAALRETPSSVGFAWTDRQLVYDQRAGGESSDGVRPPEKYSNRYHAFLHRFRAGTNSGLTVKRECFNVVGAFDEHLRAGVDTEFVLRLVQQYEFREVRRPLVLFHQHGAERVSRNARHKAAAYETIIQRNQVALREHRDLWVQYHYKAGRLHYHAGNKLKARSYFRMAFQRSPFSGKTWGALLLLELTGPLGPNIHRLISRLLKRLPMGRGRRYA